VEAASRNDVARVGSTGYGVTFAAH